MGKIFDALQKAEKDRQLFREQSPPVSAEHTKSLQPLTKTNDSEPHTSSDPSIGSISIPEEKKRHLNPELTLIPEKPIVSTAGKKNTSFLNIFNWKKKIVNQATQRDVVTINDTGDLFIEKFRQLRTQIASFCREKNIRTILIASSLPGEGKSTVASQLAMSIADSMNDPAILVDCDMIRSTIHKIFNINNSKGLSGYLTGDIPLSHTLADTDIENLSIIPAGPMPANPSALLTSHKMRNLIDQLKSDYTNSFIIFDSTPLYQTAESSVLAKYVDGIILIVREGLTSREIIKTSLDSLNKEKVIGIVFNMTRKKFKSNDDYHYYSKQEK